MNFEKTDKVKLKVLTISQPYASLIAKGEKWVENRTWGTRYRGTLAIHAGKTSRYLSRAELAQYPTGAIIAVVKLVACVNLDAVSDQDSAWRVRGITRRDFLAHEHTEGPWCWVLQEITPLASPWICLGRQGLWEMWL